MIKGLAYYAFKKKKKASQHTSDVSIAMHVPAYLHLAFEMFL